MNRTRRKLLNFILTLPALGLAGCSQIHGWHQKLTVTVTTPHGEVSGASVSGVKIRHPARWENPLADVARQSGLRGEAVVVEVAPGHYLFALLAESQQLVAFRAFMDIVNPEEKDSIRMEETRFHGDLPPSLYPMLVTFGDIAVPASVKEVNPADLAASFGEGYALKSITLEITDEVVTEGSVQGLLPWWCTYRTEHRRLSGNNGIAISNNELANNLAAGSFRTGECAK